MARRRRYGEDLTYAEWHRLVLRDLYRRRGHRLDMADRDWTEFCHWCKEPICIAEEVIDRGQDLNDKATTVTRRVAVRANIPAILIAPRFERSREVQRQIEKLNNEIRDLEAQSPIIGFTIKRLWPYPSCDLILMEPHEFAHELFLMHRDHHQHCPAAQIADAVYDLEAIDSARNTSRIWTPRQGRLRWTG